jgi:chromosome segregation ATPase
MFRKGLLLSTATLILSTPVCMAQSAIASTGGFSSSFVKAQSPFQEQTAISKLQQILPKTNQGLLSRPYSSIPSANDISDLESILSTYKEEVQSIQKEISNLTQPSEDLNRQLTAAKSKVSILEDAINELKDIRLAYKTHKQTLEAAITSYNDALLNERTIEQQYNNLVAGSASNQEAAQSARTALKTAENALTAAETALDIAQTAFNVSSTLKEQIQALADASSDALDKAITDYNDASDQFSTTSITLQAAQSAYSAALTAVTNGDTSASKALSILTAKKAAYSSALAAYNESSSDLSIKAAAKTQARASLNTSNSSLGTALSNLESSTAALSAANQTLTTAENNLFSAQQTLNQAQQNSSYATASLQTSTQQKVATASELATALSTKNVAQQNFLGASSNLNAAQNAYDTQLIQDPNWTPATQQVQRTRQVPVTTTTASGGLTAKVYNRNGYNNAPPLPTTSETPIYTTTVPKIEFQWGSGQVLNSGRSEDVIVQFTGNIVVPTSGYYRFYTPADDGTILYINNQLLINDWYDKGGGGSVSQQVYLTAGTAYPLNMYYYENGGGANVWLYYYQPTTGYQIVPAAWLGQQLTTTTTYVQETYYTTEIIPNQIAPLIKDPAKLVLLNQAQAVYNDKYAVYQGATSSYNNELIDDQIAVDNLLAAQSTYNAAVSAEQTAYNSLLAAQSSYDGASIAINTAEQDVQDAMLALTDPSEYQQQMQSNYNIAAGNYESSQLNYSNNSDALQVASNEQSAAQDIYDNLIDELVGPNELLTNSRTILEAAETTYDGAQSEVALKFALLQDTQVKNDQNQADLTNATIFVKTSSQDYSAASEQLSIKQSLKESAAAVLTVAENNALTSQQEVDTIAVKLSQARATTARAFSFQESAKETVSSTEETIKTKTEKVATVEESIKNEILPTLKIAVTKEKQKQTIPIEGSKVIPVLLTPENLMEINLKEVNPTELTVAQAEQLVKAALETFKTSEPGSPEYEQALDALYLAAEQDDIVLSEELAAIPGLAAAAELINFLGNAGADMSPARREEAQKIVVTAVVAAGVAVQAAASAATSAATSAGGSTGSSGSRRTGK